MHTENFTDKELSEYGHKLLKWGESEGLSHMRLAILLLLMKMWMHDQLGIEITEYNKIEEANS